MDTRMISQIAGVLLFLILIIFIALLVQVDEALRFAPVPVTP